jgi:GDP-L-fucose synthase
LFDNLAIAQNIIDNAHHMGVEKLVYLGSSCIYPKNAVNPITEDSLLTGALEPTNEAYAIAKIAGIKLCQAYRAQHNCNFISVMPCNLYGQYDRFESERSHVIPAMMLNMHKAMHSGEKEVLIWGSGVPRREFLHVDDLADAVHLALLKYDDAAPLNIGAGYDLPIGDLAALIKAVVGYQGVLKFDRSKPDGTAQKLMDSSRIRALGWMPQIGLSEGLNQTYQWFNRSHSSSRMVA